jgi:hypothetical protein
MYGSRFGGWGGWGYGYPRGYLGAGIGYPYGGFGYPYYGLFGGYPLLASAIYGTYGYPYGV